MFKDAMTAIEAKVKGQIKGNVWWIVEVKESIERKSRAYKKMLHKNAK